MSLNDQWEHGRIPIRPLPFALALKGSAHTCEFVIDYVRDEDGTEPNYHMYITSPDDNLELIDLTQKIIKEILPNASINANQFQINIEGVTDPVKLQDIINFIYKRFIYPDDPNGFDPERDLWKLFDPTTKDVLLRNTDGTVLLPITKASNVYDDSGKTLQERLDDMTRLGFSMTYVVAQSNDQTEFEFDFPFPDYSDFVEVRIGTVYVDKTRYAIITDDPDCKVDGKVVKGKLRFTNYFNITGPDCPFDTSVPWGERIERGRRIDILFIYNALAKSDGKYEYMYGGNIADASIPSRKLEKLSDSYTLNDPTSVASSAALYNLYMAMGDYISSNLDNAIWAVDKGTNAIIEIDAKKDVITSSAQIPTIVNIALHNDKASTCTLKVNYNTTNKTYTPIFPDGTRLARGLTKNNTIRVLLDGNTAYLLSTGTITKSVSYANHYCRDQETVISYSELSYNDGDVINVYRNGVRLFDTIDFNFTAGETITLLVRTEDGERIVFEAVSSTT